MTTHRGACLCGTVSFSVNTTALKLYQCHCSLCRKVSGAAASAAFFVRAAAFQWFGGADNISRFRRESGFTACFCRTCGSPVPHAFMDLCWIPAGLLDVEAEGQVVAHLHLDSCARWETVPEGGARYPGGPALQALLDMTCCEAPGG